jgi:hypothetical protein
MSKDVMKEPVVIVAEKKAGRSEEKVDKLSTGIKAKLGPVSASLIDEVTAKVKDPPVPMWHNEEKGRDEPNPGDPAYIEALSGVDLVDGVPEDDGWLVKLQFLGVVEDRELSAMEREFVYKKYIAVSAADVGKITELSGISSEELQEAEATFQR